MESNDLYMVAGAIALVAAAYVGAGLPVALAIAAVAFIYFAHTAPSVHLGRPRKKPVPVPQQQPEQPHILHTPAGGEPLPVQQITCDHCNSTFAMGLPHLCPKKGPAK